MHTQRRILLIAGCALLVLPAPVRRNAPEACTLLTTADASAALGATSVAGQRMMPEDPTGCIWSNDPQARDSSRRLAVNTHTLRSFQYAMHPAITTITIEPVAGIGEEAFYQIYPKDQPPFIWFRKGSTAVSIRILMGATPRPWPSAQDKPKLLVLAKAAVAKL